ncbi:hypothetical protein RHQ24_003943 [Klebsiella pneumoniae]|uniref:hypothetical protein n=1 Tax=Klebsiella pneumoniae TaxID=573 RepID=UPI00190DDDA3|nr:hypothetical protein [Klebsiella pneumoniae]EIX9144952.1 hypothetical protein [Klebsiella pneumoniae]ELB4111968.1 hypothetical protein [Klebsiella pneumoniae]HBR2962039.1 hypothetical protein [Klebsiella pneumoniae]HEL4586605.1 hypothetical protein [Klebsiella pneumoniae]
MEYQLDLKENALDSFNEALEKFKQGESGELRHYKFAILHISHFLELVLKLYISSVNENLLFSKCYRHIEKRSKRDSIELLQAYELICKEDFELSSLLEGIQHPHTITLDQALEFAKCEKCSITGVDFVDINFCNDIEWIKGRRNNIEHYQFRLSPKEARLCIGRLVRGVAEFVDIFSLFNLEDEVGKDNYQLFEILADEYSHLLKEAENEVAEKEAEAFRGVRPKHYALIEWNIYQCPECSNNTMIPSDDSSTGYKCTFCSNEESDEIEFPCDCCGTLATLEEMETWPMDDGSIEHRCYFCSGQYYADKDD